MKAASDVCLQALDAAFFMRREKYMQNTELLLKELTLEEKCALLSGAETFKTRGMPEHGIPQIWLSDGPHGLRKQAGESDHLGLNPSVPATCFPTASAVANSWDAALGEEIGAALGEEAAAQEVSVVLGPGLNMKRNPLCGRSFEYFSEDPYLAGKLAAGYIRGIQSKGVAACPKHFAVNSQETRRMASDSIVDERTLREIYLTGFEIAVKEGHPRSIMSSYNLVNGTYANENKHLLMEILRGEWGFDGAVITDYCDHHSYMNGDQALRAGGSLWMAGFTGGGMAFETGSNSYLQALRRATREALYMYLHVRVTNRDYADSIGDTTAVRHAFTTSVFGWRHLVALIDIVAVVLFALAVRGVVIDGKLRKAAKTEKKNS